MNCAVNKKNRHNENRTKDFLKLFDQKEYYP